MKDNTWKVVGFVAMVGGALFSFISNMADSKKTESMIKDEVAKAVAKEIKKSN